MRAGHGAKEQANESASRVCVKTFQTFESSLGKRGEGGQKGKFISIPWTVEVKGEGDPIHARIFANGHVNKEPYPGDKTPLQYGGQKPGKLEKSEVRRGTSQRPAFGEGSRGPHYFKCKGARTRGILGTRSSSGVAIPARVICAWEINTMQKR